MSELNTLAPYSRCICEDCEKIVTTKLVTTTINTIHGVKTVPAYACVECNVVVATPHMVFKEK